MTQFNNNSGYNYNSQSASKPIAKGDDDAKLLIIEALKGKPTGGFDLDSIYYISGNYVVLEFLKCDTVTPRNSHPSRYWNKNARKFISLWNISQKLEGELILINYSNTRNEFKLIEVLELNNNGIIREKVYMVNFDQFSKWFINLNESARGLTQRLTIPNILNPNQNPYF